MGVFFTADTHFGHGRLIANGSRPFADVAAMDQAIVGNWNAVVEPDDEVWHLGDFSSYRDGRLEGLFWRLNGIKRLVPGNHDEENDAVLALPWADRPERHVLVHVEGKAVFLSHYPMLTWPEIAKGGVQLFGHLHGAWAGNRMQVDVGVDAWGFRPVALPEIERRMRGLPPKPDLSHGPGWGGSRASVA